MNSQASTLGVPLTAISKIEEQSIGANTGTNIQSFYGRRISVIGKSLTFATNGVSQAVQSFFASLSYLAADAMTTANIFRKLDGYLIRFFEHLGIAKGSFNKFGTFIKHNVAIVDVVQVIGDIDYFATGKFRERRDENGNIKKLKDSNVLITGRLSFFAAGIGGTLLWLEEISLISLSKVSSLLGEVRLFGFVPNLLSSIPVIRDFSMLKKIANGIGNLRIFSFIKNFSCLSVTLRAIDLGYAFFAINAGMRLFNADNRNKVISACIDLASYLSELVLSAIVFAGVTNVITLGVVGVSCLSLIVASFLYQATHQKELEPTLPQSVQPGPPQEKTHNK